MGRTFVRPWAQKAMIISLQIFCHKNFLKKCNRIFEDGHKALMPHGLEKLWLVEILT